MRAEMSRVARVTGELTRTLGRAPSDEQIAQLSGLSLKRLHLVGAVPGEPLSLDMPLGEDASLTLQDSLEDGGAVRRPSRCMRRTSPNPCRSRRRRWRSCGVYASPAGCARTSRIEGPPSWLRCSEHRARRRSWRDGRSARWRGRERWSSIATVSSARSAAGRRHSDSPALPREAAKRRCAAAPLMTFEGGEDTKRSEAP